MPTKIELTLEQSQQGVSNDVLVAVCSSLRLLKPKVHKSSLEPEEIRSYALSWKPYQRDSLNLPDHRIRRPGLQPHSSEGQIS
ncbi:hypothetical protein Tco_0589864 [Tanacetum coccineum]